MAELTYEKQYEVVLERIEELLPLISNDTPATDRNMIELVIISDLAEEYEEKHYPVYLPTLPEVIRLRMAEM